MNEQKSSKHHCQSVPNNKKRKDSQMFAIIILGFGIGLEGIEQNKIYFGIYTPTAEYGMVMTQNEIYCDTVLEKN